MKIKKLFLLIFIALACLQSIRAQQDNILQLIPVVPQSSYSNPAFQPTPKWYIGFPGLSSVYFGLAHNGFVYHDLFHMRTDGLLQPTPQIAISKLGKRNYLSANVMEELLAFGFRIKKGYFNFSVTDKASFRFSYPRDLMSLFLNGNGQWLGKTADFSGIGVNAIHYREWALGFSHDIKILKQNFVIGGRVKYLQGLMNVWTKSSKAPYSISTDDYAYTLQTNYQVNVTLPDSPILNNPNKNDTNSNYYNPIDFDKLIKYLMNGSNKGLGLDFGISYKLNEKFSFGASLLDFGYIHWKTGGGSQVKNYANTVNSFTFDGIDVTQFLNKSDSVNKLKGQDILDSLGNIFKIQESKNSYWAPLPGKIYLTAIYSLTPHDKVGLLVRNEFFNKRLYPSLSLSYNKMFFNMFSASASYSIMNRGFANIGFGIALNLGPWQTYVATDNIYCLFDPEGTHNVNAHFGINFIFGYKEKKANESLYKESSDKPKKVKKQKAPKVPKTNDSTDTPKQ